MRENNGSLGNIYETIKCFAARVLEQIKTALPIMKNHVNDNARMYLNLSVRILAEIIGYKGKLIADQILVFIRLLVVFFQALVEEMEKENVKTRMA